MFGCIGARAEFSRDVSTLSTLSTVRQTGRDQASKLANEQAREMGSPS